MKFQGVSATVSAVGLIVRSKKKYTHYKYQINLLDYHFIIFVTLFAAYVFGVSQILLNLKMKDFNPWVVINGIMLIIQITLQTFLMRSEGRKLVHMRQVFALLIFCNISLWILEIFQLANIMAKMNAFIDSHALFSLFVALNRFYSTLIFIQFWKIK